MFVVLTDSTGHWRKLWKIAVTTLKNTKFFENDQHDLN